MRFIRQTCDAVYVSEAGEDCNFCHSAVIHVGYFDMRTSGVDLSPRLKEDVGLLRSVPVPLPRGQRIKTIRLFLFVLRAANGICSIGVHENRVAFDPCSITWRNMPSVCPVPIGCAIVRPQDAGSYIACEIAMEFPEEMKSMPDFSFSLRMEGQGTELVTFSSQEGVAPPYLEVVLYKEEQLWPSCIEGMFLERIFELEGHGETFSPPIDVSMSHTATFFVKNTGERLMEAELYVSPDGTDYLSDPQKLELAPGGMKAVTPYLFGRFMRVCVRGIASDQPVSARIWFQAQMNNYMVKGLQNETDMGQDEAFLP